MQNDRDDEQAQYERDEQRWLAEAAAIRAEREARTDEWFRSLEPFAEAGKNKRPDWWD